MRRLRPELRQELWRVCAGARRTRRLTLGLDGPGRGAGARRGPLRRGRGFLAVRLVVDAEAKRVPEVAQRSLHAVGDSLLARVLDALAAVLLVDRRSETDVVVEGAVLEGHPHHAGVAHAEPTSGGVLLLILLRHVQHGGAPAVEAKDSLRLVDHPPRLHVVDLGTTRTIPA